MCELLLDDTFSLLNANLPDANLTVLGSDSGFEMGNAAAVHQVVDSLLRNDQVVWTLDWNGREQTIPLKVNGPHKGARSDMGARVHLAVMDARKITMIPCDGWGAPAWWRVQWAQMNYVGRDADALLNNVQRYVITLGVDAWAKATELYTATATVADGGEDASVLTSLDVPGSAPAAGDITALKAPSGCLIYTAPVWNDHPDYNPLHAGVPFEDLPEGTYHLIVDINSRGSATAVDWEVGDQTGTTSLDTLGYDASGFVCIANDIYISAYSGTIDPVVTGVGDAVSLNKTILLWVENPLTGRSASYTMTGAAGSSPGDFVIHAPTPERPIPAYTFDGVQDPTTLRAAGGEHHIDPGARSKVFAAWAGATALTDAAVTWTGYPAFHTEVVPKSRW